MKRDLFESSSSTSDKWSPGQTLVLVGVALLLLAVITVGYIFGIEYSARRKTTTIITTIGTGLELSIGGRGGRHEVPLAFAYLEQAFAFQHIIAELRSLQAIDEKRRCFVDAWGQPLILRVGPKGESFEVISSGPDGLPGTADDLRR